MGAVDHLAQFAGIDEEDLASAVAEAAVFAVARQEPQAGRDLGGVEELARKSHHAVDQVGFDEVLADLSLARLLGGHGAVRKHEPGHSLGGQVVDHVLHPGEVGVAGRRHPVLPALVVAQAVAAPVGDVERRVGEDEIGLEVGVAVIVEGVAVCDLTLDAADGQVHAGQAPGGVVGLLAEDRDVGRDPGAYRLAAGGAASASVAIASGMCADELDRLHEHARAAAAGVVDPALEGLQHLHEQLDHAARGVELAALLAFGVRELGEKVLIDTPEHVLGAACLIAHSDVAHEIDELTETLLV